MIGGGERSFEQRAVFGQLHTIYAKIVYNERRGHQPGKIAPELVDRALVPDDHARASARGCLRETTAARARGNDVGAHVAESGQAAVFGAGAEPAQPPPGDVFEEDALHGVLGAELEDLHEPGLDRTFHCRNSRTG